MSDTLDSFPLRPLASMGDQSAGLPVFFSVSEDRTLKLQVGIDRNYSASDGYTCFLLRVRDTRWTFKNQSPGFGAEFQTGQYPSREVGAVLEARFNVLGAEVVGRKLEAAMLALERELNSTFSHPGDLTYWELTQALAWLGDHHLVLPVETPQPPDESAKFRGLQGLFSTP